MIRRIVLSVLWAVALLLPAALRAEDGMDLRWFPLPEDHYDRGEDPDPEPKTAGQEGARLTSYLHDLGVQFPTGSYVRIQHGGGRMIMFNTPPNHKRLARILAKELPSQVEIDAAFVEFPPQDIAKVAREQDGAVPSTDQFKDMWHAGQGRLLAATKTITRIDRQNGNQQLVVQQPRFHSRNAATSVLLADGATAVFGGLPNRDGDQWSYVFVTARILDAHLAPAGDFEGYPMDEE